MKGRYEIVDREYGTERGMRFSTLERAQRELAHAVPQGRFYIVDRMKPEDVDETE